MGGGLPGSGGTDFDLASSSNAMEFTGAMTAYVSRGEGAGATEVLLHSLPLQLPSFYLPLLLSPSLPLLLLLPFPPPCSQLAFPQALGQAPLPVASPALPPPSLPLGVQQPLGLTGASQEASLVLALVAQAVTLTPSEVAEVAGLVEAAGAASTTMAREASLRTIPLCRASHG